MSFHVRSSIFMLKYYDLDLILQKKKQRIQEPLLSLSHSPHLLPLTSSQATTESVSSKTN